MQRWREKPLSERTPPFAWDGCTFPEEGCIYCVGLEDLSDDEILDIPYLDELGRRTIYSFHPECFTAVLKADVLDIQINVKVME
jgi:hypothetical protein